MTARKPNKPARPETAIGRRRRNLLKRQPASDMRRDRDDLFNGIDAPLLDNAASAVVMPAIGAVAGGPFTHATAPFGARAGRT